VTVLPLAVDRVAVNVAVLVPASTSVTVTQTLLCRAATSHLAATEPWK